MRSLSLLYGLLLQGRFLCENSAWQLRSFSSLPILGQQQYDLDSAQTAIGDARGDVFLNAQNMRTSTERGILEMVVRNFNHWVPVMPGLI